MAEPFTKTPPKDTEAAPTWDAERQRTSDGKNGAPQAQRKSGRRSAQELLWTSLALVVAWLPWLLYASLVLSVMLVVYYEVESEGFRLMLPTLSKKLHKLSIPGIERLRLYQGWNKIDLANAMAAILALATFWAWDTVLKHFLSRKATIHARWDSEKFGRVMSVLAVGVIAFDAYLFYRGTQSLVWGAEGLSFGALVLTLGWAFLIVIASAISIQLQPLPKKED